MSNSRSCCFVATRLFSEKDYAQARHHLVRSQEGEACAAMLIEYQITCGFPNEVDLFIAQAVLQFVTLFL